MGLFNSLLFLSKIGSQIGNVEFDKKLFIDFKKFRQTHNLTFHNQLPEFDEIKNYILVNGKQVLTGAILKRPLDILEPLSSLKAEFHYAVVLGTSKKGEEILIEMTKGSDVSLVTKKGFLVDRFYEHHIEIYFSPKEQILDKASRFQYDGYHLLDLNCRVFVENVILDIEPPQRTLELKKFQLYLCDMAITLTRLQLSEPNNEKYRDFLIKQIEDSEKDKIRLQLSIKEMTKQQQLTS